MSNPKSRRVDVPPLPPGSSAAPVLKQYGNPADPNNGMSPQLCEQMSQMRQQIDTLSRVADGMREVNREVLKTIQDLSVSITELKRMVHSTSERGEKGIEQLKEVMQTTSLNTEFIVEATLVAAYASAQSNDTLNKATAWAKERMAEWKTEAQSQSQTGTSLKSV